MLYTLDECLGRLRSRHGHSLYKRAANWLHKKTNVEENLMRIVPHILGAAIAAALISTPVLAAELTGTLKKIKDSGTITLGTATAPSRFPTSRMLRASRWATPTTFSWPSSKP
jgi:hypothetical protein